MDDADPSYVLGTVRALIESDLVTPATRRALRARLRQAPTSSRFLDEAAFATLQAVAARLVPQPERHQGINIAELLDLRLSAGTGNGWRHERMPPDREMHRLGLAGLNQSSTAMFGHIFASLSSERQDALLGAVAAGKAVGSIWESMDGARYFEELLAELVDIYYAHPLALEEIGYAGMADAHGWQAIGLNEREIHEPEAIFIRKDAA